MANRLKKSNEMATTYEKNGATPPGFEPGAQIKMIQRVTTVPRSQSTLPTPKHHFLSQLFGVIRTQTCVILGGLSGGILRKSSICD